MSICNHFYNFFATVQNKMHYAIHHQTAAEVIVSRANHEKQNMGLTTWKNAPNGKIVKADVSIAKNYLSIEEMAELNEIVTMYLDYAIRQARRRIPMTMTDWASKLDAFLKFRIRAKSITFRMFENIEFTSNCL